MIWRLFFLVLLVSCENNMNTVNLITSKDKTPLDVEKNATVTYTESGKTSFILTAPLIENFSGQDPTLVFGKGINVDFYDDSGRMNGHLEAGYAIRHENTKLMEADNDVRLFNRKGDMLNTEQLFWDQNKHTIYTGKFVTIKTENRVIYGTGLTSNEEFTRYKINNVSGKDTINMQQQ